MRKESPHIDKRRPIKKALKWLIATVFVFQAAGGIWYAHVACCGETDAQDAAGCHDPSQVADSRAAHEIKPEAGHHSHSDGPTHHHHNPQTCGVCQVLLTLSGTPNVPLALPAVAPSAMFEPVRTDRPFIDFLRAAIDARGPPASATL